MNKYDINKVNKIFKDNNCILLSTEYKNIETHLDYICECKNYSKITLHSFLKGSRCRQCAVKKRKQNKIYELGYVQEILNKFDCQLISEYFGSNIDIEFKCKCGNIGKKTFTNFQRHPYCKICNKIKQGNYNKRNDQENKEKELKLKTYIIGTFRSFKNNRKTTKIVKEKFGYDSIDFINHISKYNIENGTIDHIFPISAFIEHNIYDLKIINHLSNIQILPMKENSKKSDKYDKDKFYDWLKSVGYQYEPNE